MRRRELLAGYGAATLSAMAGCTECGEAWPVVGFSVEPTALTQSGDGWHVDATVEVQFMSADSGSGLSGVSLAAFDETGAVVGTTQLGDLRWSAVPETARTGTDCGPRGTLQRTATVEADAVPQWVGIRYDDATQGTGSERTIAVYGGEQGSGATGDGYGPVAVSDLAPASTEVATNPPVESVTFQSFGLTCDPPTTPENGNAEPSFVSIDYARTLPEPHYRPTLAGFEFGEVVRFDIGLGPRPQLQRTACTAATYDVSVAYADTATSPDEFELRHLDRDGAVVETIRQPL